MHWLDVRPPLAERWRTLAAAVVEGPVPRSLLTACEEVVRRRVRLAPTPAEPADDAAAQACLDLAEQFVLDVHGVTDEQVAAVGAHYGDAGVVQLVVALGICEGAERARMVVAGDLPARS